MWDQLDSNQRPSDYESPALPLSYGPFFSQTVGPSRLELEAFSMSRKRSNFIPHHLGGYYWTRTSDLHNVNVAL